ncbi:MAG: hypothetical protein ACTSPK_10255 [Candidatus Heimdallarchaeota archaeon]
MPERELTPEREKRRKDFKSENAPEANAPPSEDTPEKDVAPELEGESPETESEITKKIDKTKRH